MKGIVLAAAIVLAASALAGAADNWGYVESGFYYRDLEIVPGDPVPMNTGGTSGEVKYVPTYLLGGTIENALGRARSGVQARVTATDCSGSKSYWSVVVDVGPLAPHERLPFLKFISNYQPARPCTYKVQIYGR